MDKSQLLSNLSEKYFVYHVIFQPQRQWWALAVAKVLYIVFTANSKCILEYSFLQRACLFNLLIHSRIHFFPETWHCGHTSRIGFAHRLLYTFRVVIDNQTRTDSNRKHGPCLFENMRKGKEIKHTVIFIHINTFLICLQGSMILPNCKYYSFTLACGSTGVKDVGNVVKRCFLTSLFNFTLTR